MVNGWKNLGIQAFISSIILLSFWFLPAVLTAQEEEEDIDSQRERLEEISEERALLERDLSEMRHAERFAGNELEEIDRELSAISRRLETTTAELMRKQAQVNLLGQSHALALADLEEAQVIFEARLIEWYKSGAGSVLGSIITCGDLSDFCFAMSYTEAVVESDHDTINFIREQQSQIFGERETLDDEIGECERLISEMRVEEARYEELKTRRNQRFNELENDVDQAEHALAEMDAASYEIAMLLRRSQYTGTVGALIKPIDASFGSGFGMRMHPILGRMRMHSGVDMGAPAGTPIHAAGNGLVVYSSWKNGYGYTVTLDHGSGLATLYAHCSSLLVRVGETVSRGQVIARVGSTGLSTGNHVHFEVREHGDPVDPIPYIGGG